MRTYILYMYSTGAAKLFRSIDPAPSSQCICKWSRNPFSLSACTQQRQGGRTVTRCDPSLGAAAGAWCDQCDQCGPVSWGAAAGCVRPECDPGPVPKTAPALPRRRGACDPMTDLTRGSVISRRPKLRYQTTSDLSLQLPDESST